MTFEQLNREAVRRGYLLPIEMWITQPGASRKQILSISRSKSRVGPKDPWWAWEGSRCGREAMTFSTCGYKTGSLIQPMTQTWSSHNVILNRSLSRYNGGFFSQSQSRSRGDFQFLLYKRLD